ncbi:Activating signal cointegrator 1 complex subunit 3, partial [Aduncisulcus paluster]
RAGVVEGVKIWMEEQAVGKMIDKKLIKSEKKKEEGEKDSLDLTQLSSSVLPIFCSDSGVVVYVAPLKALVRETVREWVTLSEVIGKDVVELSGDVTPDMRNVAKAGIIVTTPEKFDGLMRFWRHRELMQRVSCVVFDEIHLLDYERGPVIESMVVKLHQMNAWKEEKRKEHWELFHQKLKEPSAIVHDSPAASLHHAVRKHLFISENPLFYPLKCRNTRILALTTAIANAQELAKWLHVSERGLFNFHPFLRPVQLEKHIQGFPGRAYCPRMGSMNKSVYQALKKYAPRTNRPTIIFVTSRRQTRLTGQALAAYAATDEAPIYPITRPDGSVFSPSIRRTPDPSLLAEMDNISDEDCKNLLPYGILLHHAAMSDSDRRTVERLFLLRKCSVMVATSTLAWGVNLPAYCVIVKGCVYFDGPKGSYVDMKVTEIMQAVGRAGRPQFVEEEKRMGLPSAQKDPEAVAIVMCKSDMKDFYKTFLNEPFPVESSFHTKIPEHIISEISVGAIKTLFDVVSWLKNTFYYLRMCSQPSRYGLYADATEGEKEVWLCGVAATAILELVHCGCIDLSCDTDKSALVELARPIVSVCESDGVWPGFFS